eukprot:TRINITY_DN10555_c0_g1_i1.p2 TRINITY_DN10555_c0_g1~~TRINITY_DN10555_c0_g1_i1.p2  ORF type:complete len:199 (-),score=-23.74 TRINITY_DN10555_c0_g1_i1:97-693(-)
MFKTLTMWILPMVHIKNMLQTHIYKYIQKYMYIYIKVHVIQQIKIKKHPKHSQHKITENPMFYASQTRYVQQVEYAFSYVYFCLYAFNFLKQYIVNVYSCIYMQVCNCQFQIINSTKNFFKQTYEYIFKKQTLAMQNCKKIIALHICEYRTLYNTGIFLWIDYYNIYDILYTGIYILANQKRRYTCENVFINQKYRGW